MKYSRLSRIEESRTKKQLIVTLIGIIVLIIILFTLGIPLMIAGTQLFGKIQEGSQSAILDSTPPVPPVISTPVEATNSARLLLEGYGEPESTLRIFVNDSEIKEVLIGNDGRFNFPDIILNKGLNSVYATSTDDFGNESQPSATIQVSFNSNNPQLEVIEPQDGQIFGHNQQEITVSGNSDPGVSLFINDRFVPVLDTGHFTYRHKLDNGENVLNITVRNSAGNETKLERKVTYQP